MVPNDTQEDDEEEEEDVDNDRWLKNIIIEKTHHGDDGNDDNEVDDDDDGDDDGDGDDGDDDKKSSWWWVEHNLMIPANKPTNWHDFIQHTWSLQHDQPIKKGLRALKLEGNQRCLQMLCIDFSNGAPHQWLTSTVTGAVGRLDMIATLPYDDDSVQIMIFHQPGFPWNKGTSLP